MHSIQLVFGYFKSHNYIGHKMLHIHIICEEWIHVVSKEIIVCSCVSNNVSVLEENHILLMILYESPNFYRNVFFQRKLARRKVL
jgi:2-hydroxy-3-keto-5-methylthiopentenyl-1-phosphate phosphatase